MRLFNHACSRTVGVLLMSGLAACSSSTAGMPHSSTASKPQQYADIRALCTKIGYLFTEDDPPHEL